MLQDEGDAWLLEAVNQRIIGCAFRVAYTLGHALVAERRAYPEMPKRLAGDFGRSPDALPFIRLQSLPPPRASRHRPKIKPRPAIVRAGYRT
jgi:hypothetical protein